MKHDEPVTMCSLESETMYSLEWLRHERRKAWQEGYAAGWKDQECDLRHDDGQDRRRDMGLSDRPWQDHRLRHRGGIQMKKMLEDMIIKWHQAGYALDEIAPLVPQVPKAEIAAIIHQHDKETRL